MAIYLWLKLCLFIVWNAVLHIFRVFAVGRIPGHYIIQKAIHDRGFAKVIDIKILKLSHHQELKVIALNNLYT